MRLFSKDRGGSVALMFGIMFPLIVLGIAGSVQYANTVNKKRDFQSSVDAASLAAARSVKNSRSEGLSDEEAFAIAERLAENFLIDAAKRDNIDITEQPVVEVSLDNSVIVANISAAGSAATGFNRFLGGRLSEFSVGGESRLGSARFVELNFIVDVSASMGVGATTADHTIMDTNANCAFACHVPSTSTEWISTRDSLRAAGATLRIDVIRDAVRDALNGLDPALIASGEVTIALHTFSNTFRTVLPPSSDISAIQTTLDTVDLIGEEFETGTNFHQALQQASDQIRVGGDGFTVDSPKVMTVLLTDGVSSNVRYNAAAATEQEADPNFIEFAPNFGGSLAFAMQGFDPIACDPLKTTNDATMMTVNIEYIEPVVGTDDDPRFSQIANSIAPDIERNLERCASASDLSFEASSPVEIRDALGEAIEAVNDIINLRVSS
jgi:Flp pilus assembly protein TadG